MISALVVFNQRGEVLLNQIFKEDVKRNISDVFRIHFIANPELRSPVLTLGSTSFLHTRLNNLWVVAVTRSNMDASIIFEFLYKFCDLVKSYLGKSVDDTTFRNNFVLMNDLVDAVLDFGYPQSVDFDVVKELVPPPHPIIGDGTSPHGLIQRAATLTRRRSSTIPKLVTDTATSDIPWRKKGIKYRKNQFFLDVVENVNVLISSTGTVLSSSVDGVVESKAQLSGLPVCHFGFENGDGDSRFVENCKFHQSVDLKNHDQEGLIKFVPPDGSFQLMSYRCPEIIQLPFHVSAQMKTLTGNQVIYQISLRSSFSSKLMATDVFLEIPTAPGTIDARAESSSGGKLKCFFEESKVQWSFNKYVGGADHSITLATKVNDTSANSFINWQRPPLRLKFNIDMFCCSGLAVKYLKVVEPTNGYTTVKWVRYVTKSGAYEIRC